MNLALWIVAIVLAAAFAGSGLMKQFVPKDKLVDVWPGLGAGLHSDQYPIDRTCRGTRRGRTDLASRHTHRPNPRPVGSDRVGSRNGGRGHCSCPAQRTNERHRQHRAAGTGRLRCLGQARLVYLHVLADANV